MISSSSINVGMINLEKMKHNTQMRVQVLEEVVCWQLTISSIRISIELF